ncbi:hypothetical protein, partial [Acinetobacter sp.]|uniref:hypothetical protein n=1 Tax=Acinetobacter sp. TaxID=472 RepID=UPI0035B4628E
WVRADRPRTSMASIMRWRSSVMTISFYAGQKCPDRRLVINAPDCKPCANKNAVAACESQPPRQRFSSTPSSPAPEPKAEGTNTGHENAEGMASVGVRVQRPVRPAFHGI